MLNDAARMRCLSEADLISGEIDSPRCPSESVDDGLQRGLAGILAKV